MFLFPPSAFEFLGKLCVTQAILVKVEQVQAQTVLHFALAEIMQVRLPMSVLS
jgi:hypothetical protein